MNLPEGIPRNSEVRLVTAGPAEAQEIESMAKKVWPAAYAGIISEAQIEFMLQWMYSPPTLVSEMTREGIRYFWISSNETKMGFIATGPSTETAAVCHLHKFYLLPCWQHRGIGRRAMEQLIKLLQSAGLDRIELRVNRNNDRAIAFYRKSGFEVYAEDCRDIGSGFVMDDLLLRRLIP